jgi:enamine deaminase RidA (YjgF/YER057c/UK114 family)
MPDVNQQLLEKTLTSTYRSFKGLASYWRIVADTTIGDDIKVSGTVSMDNNGNPTAVGYLEQQMKNVYSDLEQVLKHYGLTFDDVLVENVFTTDMARFLEVPAYRNSIYTNQFPTGSWLEIKGLALPELMIEIELEAHSSR